MPNFFGGMLGKAEEALKGRTKQIASQEDEALGRTSDKEEDSVRKDAKQRQLRNEQAAEGKTRLSTADKKY
jgi:hypothetical protein